MDRSSAVAALSERDSMLEDFLASPAMCDDAGHFEYPCQWDQIAVLLDHRPVEATRLMHDNDIALEHYLTTIGCHGINESTGATCQFEYPSHWPQIGAWLFSGDPAKVREAVLLLERRDVALEDWIRSRTCG